MKKEQNEKKCYELPMIQFVTVDSHDIIATSGGDGDNGEGDDFYHGVLG